MLFEKTASAHSGETYYIDEPDDAFKPLCEILRNGDIFITVGAGNNWPLGEKLFAYFKSIDGRRTHYD